MPVFTVTVQGPGGQTKTVTVNTDDMSAEVVPNTVSNDSNPFLKMESSVSNMVQSSDNPFLQAAVSAKSEAAEVLPHNFQKGVDHWATTGANVESTSVNGGKRSTRIFRSKKTRHTRKLRR